MALYHVPDHLMIHDVVAVDEDVAKTDDTRGMVDAYGKRRGRLAQPPSASPMITNCRSTAERSRRSAR
jgi:hypothetical protein